MERDIASLLTVGALLLVGCSQGLHPNGTDQAPQASDFPIAETRLDPARPTSDQENIQGTWDVVNAESNGEPPPPGKMEGAAFIFFGDQVTFLGKAGTFLVDEGHSPRHIVFLLGRVRQIGIYELDGDSLRLCVGPRDDRPTEFRTRPGTDLSYFALKRRR
jgi:uncharacterized protein (TIGR03067 family)